MNQPSDKTSLSKTLLQAAWLAVLLGLGMEVVLLAVAAGFKNSMTAQAIVADLVQKVSWSTFVCVGVALGTAASKMRPQAMGLAGLIAAPIAFGIAKVLHKSASQALSLAGPTAAAGPSPFLLAFLKGLEYAVLGYVVGKLGRSQAGLRAHALAGCIIGVIFGGVIIYVTVTMAAKPLPLAGIISRSVNELVFPIGCSIVLYTVQRLGEKQNISS